MSNSAHMHEPEHSTITFSLDGAMDDQSASAALRRLGVGLGQRAGHPGELPSGRKAIGSGRWIACGLASDGVVELWPAPDAPDSPEGLDAGSLERQLDAAGLPYVVYRP